MSGKFPNLKTLRNLVNDFDNKLSNKNSKSPYKTIDIDEELNSALRTKSKSFNKSYDKELLSKAKLEMELIDRELKNSPPPDDLCLSSKSDSLKLSSSFHLTKSSAFSQNKSLKPKPSPKQSQLETALETIKTLNATIEDKDKKIFILEQKLAEKNELAETSLKKLTQNTKLIKNNEKNIVKIKKEYEDKLKKE
ncbi:hypothetical protein SteCoe_10427 [Stentor coeruleus]|uniref:Uncharacterized protein n=1 Tax=Stentor coeruleus TaxID=5963 RepID=A0A1R2CFJ5_9CILI|nr:hypothetical protein SteCoe_10427 [Stentor coeruleus]